MNWKRAAIGAAVAIPMVALLGFGLTRDPREIPSPLPGREAPQFSLAVIRKGDAQMSGPSVGDTVRLAEMRGQVVVLNYFASWCLACRDEHAVLNEVGRRYAGAPDVRFFAVLYNDEIPNGIRWIQQMGGQSYPALTDPGSRTAIDYGLYGVPETFFIGKDGRVAKKHVGPVTEQVLVQEVERLRAASAPAGSPGAAPDVGRDAAPAVPVEPGAAGTAGGAR
ncbi:MAG TPA: redoxin domain-containing protein [Gemmatimonadaceae bacterium]|nr:redoxin domain-containing protein [Gemmatimonadaceae bacterium]